MQGELQSHFAILIRDTQNRFADRFFCISLLALRVSRSSHVVTPAIAAQSLTGVWVYGISPNYKTFNMIPPRSLFIVTTLSFFSIAATAISRIAPTFDDVDKAAPPPALPGTPDLYRLPYPRLNLTEGSAGSNIEIASKYNTVSYGGSQIHSAADLKQKYPETMVLRYFVSPYQSVKAGTGNGRPFRSSATASTGSDVFAGHWLYLAGSKLRTSIDSNDLVLPVDDSRRFSAGQFVVIYNGGPGAFLNAEHAKITSIDHAKGTLTLASRGFKSNPTSHPAGAVVAQHQLGAAGAGNTKPPEDWSYNFGSRCPRDANGKQMNVVMADWLSANLSLDESGNPVGRFEFDGVLFDGERGYFTPLDTVDMDNDLVAEGGLDRDTSENMHGEGIEALYARLRSRLGGSKILVASNGDMRGFADLNGTQCEGYPHVGTSYVSPPNYVLNDQKLASYAYHVHHHAYGPAYTEILSKTPTLIYPNLENGGSRPTSNAPFRYSFGMALLENGSYGQKRTGFQPWWDEYSVDVVSGSPTWGQAIPNDDTRTTQIDKVRKHTGWLGSPLGARSRIFDPSQFDVSKTLLPDAGFESGQGRWTSQNIRLSSGTGFAGAFSLHSAPMTNYSTDVYAASVTSPVIHSSSPQTYTLCFAVKAAEVREFGVRFGSGTMQTLFSDPKWKAHTITFEADAGDNTVNFYLGRESSEMWFDEVYLFKGNPDVFRRDFEKGTVFVNGTPTRQTIDTNGKFRRIKGTQDSVNDGSAVGPQITLPAYDAAIVIRVP